MSGPATVPLAGSRPSSKMRGSVFKGCAEVFLSGVLSLHWSIAAGSGARAHHFPGTPFEPGGAAKRGRQTPHWVGPLVTLHEVPELVDKFAKEKLVAGGSGSCSSHV